MWDSEQGRSVVRPVILGPADPPPTADLGATRTIGTRAVGNVGALVWVAEQLDLIGCIDRACGHHGSKRGPSIGEMVVAMAIQRACSPGPKRNLGEFLDGSLPRISCLPASAFTGQAFHRLAQKVTDAELDAAQVSIAKAAVQRFKLSTDVLEFVQRHRRHIHQAVRRLGGVRTADLDRPSGGGRLGGGWSAGFGRRFAHGDRAHRGLQRDVAADPEQQRSQDLLDIGDFGTQLRRLAANDLPLDRLRVPECSGSTLVRAMGGRSLRRGLRAPDG